MIFKRCVQRVQTTFYPQTFLGNLIDTAVHRGNLSLCNFQISQLYQTRMQSILEYLITVEHLSNMHNRKLPFIRFEKMKKDNFMLSINNQCKAFSINLNTRHMNGKTPRIACSTFIKYSRVVNSMRGNFSHPTYKSLQFYLFFVRIQSRTFRLNGARSQEEFPFCHSQRHNLGLFWLSRGEGGKNTIFHQLQFGIQDYCLMWENVGNQYVTAAKSGDG